MAPTRMLPPNAHTAVRLSKPGSNAPLANVFCWIESCYALATAMLPLAITAFNRRLVGRRPCAGITFSQKPSLSPAKLSGIDMCHIIPIIFLAIVAFEDR